MKKKAIGIWTFTKKVVLEFMDDNVMKYGASLSYYTVFSLAPMLIIIISICGRIFGREAVQGQLYSEIKEMVGSQAAIQIQDMIKNIHLTKDSPVATTVSIIVLLVGGTGMFGEIQDSLNRIWGLKVKATKAWWKLILSRLLSFSLIISLGFVMMVSLLLNAVIAIVGDRLNNLVAGVDRVFIPVIDNLLTFTITTLLFAVIFKVLPDARIKWKDVTVGAFITAILFTLGKIGIGFYLGKSNLATIYGAAGSVVIIMIWAYYSSVILYLGAEVTKVYATQYGGKIQPSEFSEWIIIEQIPVANATLKEEVLSTNPKP
ncbi:MAG: YihY/virulence factor BrkB family protein [Ferruginibacter sp.]